MSETEKPLVTFALFAYNQERFIREAVEGALSQTYSPLEIILSDDCSTDRTFQIMEELASEYTATHEVILNRNLSNLGIGGHINKVMELCHGELVVVAAGDDISLPHRVKAITKLWLDNQKVPCSIYSKSMIIDSDGVTVGELDSPVKERTLEESVMRYMCGVQGASHAWSRRVFDVYGPLLADTVCEDRVIPLRSELMGGIKYIPQVLVKYRVHDSNVSHFGSTDEASIIGTTVKIHERNKNIYLNYITDLATAMRNNHLQVATVEELISKLEIEIELIQYKIDFLQGGVLVKSRIILLNLLSNPRQALHWLVILLSPRMYIASQKKNFGIS